MPADRLPTISLDVGAWSQPISASYTSNMSGGRNNAYRGADVTRNNDYWLPQNISGNSAIGQSWAMLNARVRDMARNDPLWTKVISQLQSLVIADGLKTFAAAVDGSGEAIDDYNDESDTWFERWAEDEADADGEKSLWEMQQLSFREMAEVGASLWLRVLKRDRDRVSPLSFKLLEIEQLARDYDTMAAMNSGNLPNGHRVQNGIEYDTANKKVAYWLYIDHPYDTTVSFNAVAKRVPAYRVIHNYLPSRISDTTGISWFAAMMQTSRDRDQLIANTLTSTAVQALLTLVVKQNKATANGGAPADLDEIESISSTPKIGMGYPFIATVDRDDEVEVAESRKGLTELNAFANMLWTLESMGSRLSMNRVLGDPTRANMASIRASHEDDDALMSPIRQHQGRRVAKRIRREWTRLAIATGLLDSVSAETFNASPYRYLSFDVVGSHRGDVSPVEAIEAASARMRSLTTTYQAECARNNLPWRHVIRSWATVNRYLEKHGVILDLSKGQGGQVTQSSTMSAGDRETSGANNSE